MEPHAAAYDAWTEAENLANSAERALDDVLFNGGAPPADLVKMARQLRSDATASLLAWLLEVHGTRSPGRSKASS